MTRKPRTESKTAFMVMPDGGPWLWRNWTSVHCCRPRLYLAGLARSIISLTRWMKSGPKAPYVDGNESILPFLVCNHFTRRPCWCSIQKKFLGKICIKIEFISQRRETLLFLTTNMAAVTSLANQQLIGVVPVNSECETPGNKPRLGATSLRCFLQNHDFLEWTSN